MDFRDGWTELHQRKRLVATGREPAQQLFGTGEPLREEARVVGEVVLLVGVVDDIEQDRRQCGKVHIFVALATNYRAGALGRGQAEMCLGCEAGHIGQQLRVT